jgi:hypothetical protein
LLEQFEEFVMAAFLIVRIFGPRTFTFVPAAPVSGAGTPADAAVRRSSFRSAIDAHAVATTLLVASSEVLLITWLAGLLGVGLCGIFGSTP